MDFQNQSGPVTPQLETLNPENVDDQNPNGATKAEAEGIAAETSIETGGEVQMVNAHERQLMDMYKSYKVKLNFTPMNKNLIGLSQSIICMIYEKKTQRFHSSHQQVINTFKPWQANLHKQLTSRPGQVTISRIVGYMLPPVSLYCGTGEYNGGPKAHWENIIGSFKMYLCVTVNNWVLLTTDVYLENTKRYSENLVEIAHSMGFNLSPPKIISIKKDDTASYLQTLDAIFNEINPSLIVVMMAKNRVNTYQSIKNKLCVDLGVPSQVVSVKSLTERNRTVHAKLLIQINCKLGGTPWTIDIPVKGMMIVGFNTFRDVELNTISGALIATLDDTHSSFYNYVETYATNIDMSYSIGNMFLMALEKYKEKNGKLPASIVIYRAGIEDGYISLIHEKEFQNIKTKYLGLYAGKEPPIAYILVQRRYQSQLFVSTKSGEINNAFSGTVVHFNSEINPIKYDFLMMSRHLYHCIETPTYYRVLQDTLVDWSCEQMINLTYKLTHVSYNKAYASSTPGVCELAGKLAWYSSHYLNNYRNSKLDESLFFL